MWAACSWLTGENPSQRIRLKYNKNEMLRMRPQNSQGRLESEGCAAGARGALGLITTGKVLFRLAFWCAPRAPAAATSTLDGAALGPLGASARCFWTPSPWKRSTQHCVWHRKVTHRFLLNSLVG